MLDIIVFTLVALLIAGFLILLFKAYKYFFKDDAGAGRDGIHFACAYTVFVICCIIIFCGIWFTKP